uniref:DNA polymerase epsilon subunit n=1 Tax=Phallusia mammillata TaxID=59560 RepID=A0A6F9DQ37_9ASCI|nr:DNA polymerase epsilon subunit 2 [Phallusia mammillata]
MAASDQRVKSTIISAFKMHGFTLRSDASGYLTEILGPVNEVEREDWIDRILEAIQKQTLTSNIIDADIVEEAVKECDTGDDESDQVLSVIDAFSVPRFIYNSERKKFIKAEELGLPPPTLLSSANDKAELFRERYKVLYQRTSRHKLFTPPIPGLDEVNAKKFQLRNVEYLLGCTAKLKEIIVLGMITQLKERKYFLEDLTGAVELDLTEAKFHTGLFTENSFVLAEGWYEDEVFHVTAFGFPPLEAAKTTRAYYGNTNFFGGPSALCAKASTKLQELEQKNEDAAFMFLSDVWLDQEKVLHKLETLFIGYQENPPTCIVLCGTFCSKPYGLSHSSDVKAGLNNLARMILRFPHIHRQTKFVFVPSSSDVGFGKILPRPALPSIVTEDFVRKVPNAIFTSNPCRIQYCTQEIVIFREDIVKKMCRNSLKCPTSDIPTQFVKSILAQGNLSPLPLAVSPVYWSHDHALRLYPVPDLVVFADQLAEPYQVNQIDCLCINPGSFACGDFSFGVYYPSNKTVDDCKVEE